MKLTFMLVGLLLGSVSFAQSASKYDRIKELYDLGQPPTVAELNGVWSGRCFDSSNRDQAKLATFGLPEIIDDSAGPEFPPMIKKIFIFDDYSEPSTKADAIRDYSDNVVTPTENPTDVEVLLNSYRYSIRRNGTYIMVFNIDRDEHCYFYKPVM